MRIPVLIISVASLIALGGIAKADDHLDSAEHHGLQTGSTAADNTHAYTENKAGNSGDTAPGQGSPNAGDDQTTPSVGVDELNPQAQDKVPFGEEE
jgi:hypothetical protein